MAGLSLNLQIESIFLDPISEKYIIEDIFKALQFFLGDGVFVDIPDLYADTDGSGDIDSSDLLYGLVDLNEVMTSAIFQTGRSGKTS